MPYSNAKQIMENIELYIKNLLYMEWNQNLKL